MPKIILNGETVNFDDDSVYLLIATMCLCSNPTNENFYDQKAETVFKDLLKSINPPDEQKIKTAVRKCLLLLHPDRVNTKIKAALRSLKPNDDITETVNILPNFLNSLKYTDDDGLQTLERISQNNLMIFLNFIKPEFIKGSKVLPSVTPEVRSQPIPPFMTPRMARQAPLQYAKFGEGEKNISINGTPAQINEITQQFVDANRSVNMENISAEDDGVNNRSATFKNLTVAQKNSLLQILREARAIDGTPPAPSPLQYAKFGEGEKNISINRTPAQINEITQQFVDANRSVNMENISAEDDGVNNRSATFKNLTVAQKTSLLQILSENRAIDSTPPPTQDQGRRGPNRS